MCATAAKATLNTYVQENRPAKGQSGAGISGDRCMTDPQWQQLMDAINGEGLRFTQFYVASPIGANSAVNSVPRLMATGDCG